MNSGSHKMYDYEVAPPPGVWEKIESALDESELDLKFPSALYNYQAEPPAHTWEKIANALDEPLVSDYAAKLGSIEVAPPAAAWEKISMALEPAPVRRMTNPWLKYAAAAVIIGLLAWGGVQLFNNNKKTEVAANSEKDIPAQLITNPGKEIMTAADGNLAVAEMNAAIEEARNDAALEESKRTYASLDVSRKRSKVKNAADFLFISEEYDYPEGVASGTPRGLDFTAAPPAEEPPVDMTKRYIVLMTPEGNIFRMSKKLGNLVCCVSGEEMDKDCMDQMKKWREKIANPSATHTPGNFLDLLHMLNTMQDN